MDDKKLFQLPEFPYHKKTQQEAHIFFHLKY